MTERPTHLIIVTHPGEAGLELFSAHYTEVEARLMQARLERLLSPTGSKAHLIEVPLDDGVADVGELPPLVAQTVQAVTVFPGAIAPAPAPAEKPAPFRRLSHEQFIAETEAMEMSGARVIDTPDPGYNGAFS